MPTEESEIAERLDFSLQEIRVALISLRDDGYISGRKQANITVKNLTVTPKGIVALRRVNKDENNDIASSPVGPSANWRPWGDHPLYIVITLILAVVGVAIANFGPIRFPWNGAIPATPGQPLTDSTSVSTPTTAILVNTLSSVEFDFETDHVGWVTSEGDYKLAELALSTEQVHSGTNSLRLTTELFANASMEFANGSGDEIYHKTEVTAYLNRALPDGREDGYDLSGNTVSCFVYLPKGLLDTDQRPAYIRLFAKDVDYRNHFSQPLDITSSRVDTWLQLNMTIGLALTGNPPDTGFDPTRINAIGIRLDTASGSTLAYSGQVYIDNCTLEYP